mgnify:CR=1 FL=1
MSEVKDLFLSTISSPPVDWELGVAVNIDVKDQLYKNGYDSIDIDLEAAKQAIVSTQEKDTKPGLVLINITSWLQEQKKYPQKRGGYAHQLGWGSLAVIALGPDEKTLFSQEAHQEISVHELKHCTDFASPTMQNKQREYSRSLRTRGLLKAAVMCEIWNSVVDKFLLLNKSYPSSFGYNGNDGRSSYPRENNAAAAKLYSGSPFEQAAYATTDASHDLQKIISLNKN